MKASNLTKSILLKRNYKMKICENMKICEKQDCPHIEDHDKFDEPENSCAVPCDVAGGITGSRCVDHQVDVDSDLDCNDSGPGM
jgi:hypothetical protein